MVSIDKKMMKKKWQLNKRDAQNFLTVALYDVTCHSIDFLVVLICKVFLSIKNEFAVAGNITPPPSLSHYVCLSVCLFFYQEQYVSIAAQPRGRRQTQCVLCMQQ